MTGAMGLKGGLLKGKIMLNLDTEDDHELTIGCAGGIDVTAAGKYTVKTLDKLRPTYRISIKGLTGGHSGMDIHLGRGNANKLMNYRSRYSIDCRKVGSRKYNVKQKVSTKFTTKYLCLPKWDL